MKQILFFLFFIFSFSVFSQNNFSSGAFREVISLKNGSIIKGIIVEVEAPQSIGIRTSDGNLYIFHNDEISIIYKEEVLLSVEPHLYKYVHKKKEPALSFVLSFLLPGGGQYYNEQYGKGAIMTSLWAGSLAMMIGGASEIKTYEGDGYYHYETRSHGLVLGGVLLYVGNYLWSMIDAPVSSIKINNKIRFGERSYLSINPDCSFINQPINKGSKVSPVFGMKMNLNF